MTIFQNIIDVTTIEKEQPDNTTSKQTIGRMAIGRMAIGKEEPKAASLKGTVYAYMPNLLYLELDFILL